MPDDDTEQPDQQTFAPDPTPQVGIIHLNEQTVFLDTTGQIAPHAHRYYHSVWRYKYPPYGYCPFYLESYDRSSKLFSIKVLDDGRVLDSIPLDYPVVPISEEEAQRMVEHRRTGLKKPGTTTKMDLSNRKPTPPTTMAETKTPEGAPTDTRTPIRQLALAGFAANKDRKVLIDEIHALYPEKEKKKIAQLVTLYKYNESDAAKAKANEKKAAKAAAKAAATPAPVAA